MSGAAGVGAEHAPRRRWAYLLLAGIACAGFIALGSWQLERRGWKLDLIARVDARVHAEAVDAPASSAWPQLNLARDEYRRVRAVGTLLHERETLVQATTELGGGYWVLTPLRVRDGSIVLINRGFVPPERRGRKTRFRGEPAGEVALTGLLRWSEPRGAPLRSNDPSANRWYSRDVAAIAAARGLGGDPVAPYFIDADAGPSSRVTSAVSAPSASSASSASSTAPATSASSGSSAASVAPAAAAAAAAQLDPTQPVGGLTVIAFRNDHLVYALTWYAMALLSGAALVRLLRPMPK